VREHGGVTAIVGDSLFGEDERLARLIAMDATGGVTLDWSSRGELTAAAPRIGAEAQSCPFFST